MKKLLGISILSICFALIVRAQDCDIRLHFEDFIHIEKLTFGQNEVFLQKVKEVESSDCVAEVINQQPIFFDYLFVHFSDIRSRSSQKYLSIQDSTERRLEYFKDLQNDSLLNATLNTYQLKTHGQSQIKDTFSMDQVINIAVKYFSVLGLNNEGNYRVKICVGDNDIKDTESNRRPYLEAFCFSSVLKNLTHPDYQLQESFYDTVRNLYLLNLGVKPEERVLRAQGAVFMSMSQNENLKQALMDEYNLRKEVLPFLIEE